MVFKEQHKTALAKILSDITQCDGIVNQGEIDFLQKAYKVFRIPLTCRKKATHLSLSEAVRMLKSLGKREKISILWAFQNLSVSFQNELCSPHPAEIVRRVFPVNRIRYRYLFNVLRNV